MRITIGLQSVLAGATLALFVAGAGFAQDGLPDIPERDEGEGPFERLILRGAYMIDGTGAPTQGPVDIVVENDRIAEIDVVGYPRLEIDPDDRPPLNGGREIEVSGMYLLPGFIDTHLHLHSEQTGQNVPPDYILKLWLAHGVTTGRTVSGSHGTPWEVDVAERLAANEITGPSH